MDNKSNSSLKAMEIVSRPVPKWVIDRFEEDWAVLNNTHTLETISLPQTALPGDAKPGDTLVRQNGKWYKDEADTQARKRRISEKFAKIKASNRL